MSADVSSGGALPRRGVHFLAVGFLALVVGVQACAGSAPAEGLTLLKASENAGITASYRAGDLVLHLDATVAGDTIVSTVSGPAGNVITRLEIPDIDDREVDLHALVDAAGRDTEEGIKAIVAEPDSLVSYLQGYYFAGEELDKQLPTDLPLQLRRALLLHGTIFTKAALHIDPKATMEAEVAAELPENGAETVEYSEAGSTCSGCAPNDEGTEYCGDPASGSGPTGAPACYGHWTYYANGSGCYGACGPGCGWCFPDVFYLEGGYYCYTNAFCQWHDAHCGAYLHFFNCR